jgi:hypothetical protein
MERSYEKFGSHRGRGSSWTGVIMHCGVGGLRLVQNSKKTRLDVMIS